MSKTLDTKADKATLNKLRYLSINQLSQVTGRDRATVTKRLETTKPYKEDGRAIIYDAHEAIPIIFAAESFKGMQKKIEQVNYDIEKEKLHKIRTENELKLGKIIPIEDVVSYIEREYTFVRAQIKSLPARLSKMLSMESDVLKINQIMTGEIDEVLKELSTDEVYKKHLEDLKKVENASTPTSPTPSKAENTEATSED